MGKINDKGSLYRGNTEPGLQACLFLDNYSPSINSAYCVMPALKMVIYE